MRRALACLMIAAMGLPFVLTGAVLIRFHLERDRIIREVCVQRSQPIENNCCKGRCHLRKQLQAQEGPHQSAPRPTRIELRVEPAIGNVIAPWSVLPAIAERLFAPEVNGGLAAGFPSAAEHVPWA